MDPQAAEGELGLDIRDGAEGGDGSPGAERRHHLRQRERVHPRRLGDGRDVLRPRQHRRDDASLGGIGVRNQVGHVSVHGERPMRTPMVSEE